MIQKDYVCFDCGVLLEAKADKCPKCGSLNIKRIDGRIEKVLTIRSGVSAKVRDKIGKKPTSEYVSRQQLGKNGKEAKVTYAVDREKGTYFQNVEEQDEKGKWKTVHHEEESLEEHNKKTKCKKQDHTML
jgi:hypothetical protein